MFNSPRAQSYLDFLFFSYGRPALNQRPAHPGSRGSTTFPPNDVVKRQAEGLEAKARQIERDFGFPKDRAMQALNTFGGDLDRAVSQLLDET